MPKKGYKQTEEHREKLGLIRRGSIPWNKGKKLPYIPHPKHRGFIPWNKGNHLKLNNALIEWREGGGEPWNKNKKGHQKTTEQKEKIKRIAMERGYGMWMVGKKHSEKTKEIMGLSHAKEKSHWWKGGISFEPYSLDWTELLRKNIRKRDKHTCLSCNKIQENRIYCVHHIDYNKKNCNSDNLITLCGGCHSKTNKNRDYWTNYFKIINYERTKTR